MDLLKYINNTIVIIIFISVILSTILIAKRLQLILKPITNINFSVVFNYSLISFFFNITTLAGSGEIIKYILLKKKRIKINNLISTFFIEKFFGLISTTSIIIFIYFFFMNEIFLIISLISMFVFVSLLIKNNLFVKYLPYMNFNEFNLSTNLKKISIKYIYITSILIHSVFIIQFYSIFMFQGIDISIRELLIFILFLLIMNSIPLFFMGFGARELAVIIFSQFYNVDIQSMLNLTLTFGLIYFIIAIFISIIVYFASLKYLKINLINYILKKNK